MTDNYTASNATAAAAATTPPETAESYYFPPDFFEPIFLHQIIITKVLAFLSAMGSAYIIYSLAIYAKDAEHRRKKLHRTFDRLLLCLSVSDLIASISLFMGSW